MLWPMTAIILPYSAMDFFRVLIINKYLHKWEARKRLSNKRMALLDAEVTESDVQECKNELADLCAARSVVGVL